MNEAFLGLGGNIGNRMENLELALAAIERRCGTLAQRSGVYETAAWGTGNAPGYLNMVVKLHTVLDAAALLHELLAIEKELGRVRLGHRYANRTMDTDILFFNNEIINAEHLHIPHPRLHLRNFVLVPLNDIAPGLVHPVLKKTARELLGACADTSEVKAHIP